MGFGGIGGAGFDVTLWWGTFEGSVPLVGKLEEGLGGTIGGTTSFSSAILLLSIPSFVWEKPVLWRFEIRGIIGGGTTGESAVRIGGGGRGGAWFEIEHSLLDGELVLGGMGGAFSSLSLLLSVSFTGGDIGIGVTKGSFLGGGGRGGAFWISGNGGGGFQYESWEVSCIIAGGFGGSLGGGLGGSVSSKSLFNSFTPDATGESGPPLPLRSLLIWASISCSSDRMEGEYFFFSPCLRIVASNKWAKVPGWELGGRRSNLCSLNLK